MRKTSFIVMLFMAFSLPAFVACSSSDDDVPQEQTDGGDSQEDSQKQKLEAIANDLMGKISADDFRNITDLFDYVERTSNDDTAVDDWFDACKDACLLAGSTASDARYLYRASNFYGQFELVGGTWVKKGSDANLQFKFRDGNNRECVLLVTHSGKDTKVHHEEFDEEDWYYSYPYGSYWERTENAFLIPENISVTLTQGGSQLASVTVKTTISLSDASGEVHLDKDHMSVTSTLRVNGYSFVVNNAAINAGSSASLTASLAKGSETLISTQVQATGNTTQDDNVTVRRVSTTTDILGSRLRIAGTVSDMKRFTECLDEADWYDYDETSFKKAIDEANTLLDVNVYFDGSSEASSSVKLYPVVDTDYYHGEEWTYEPVFNFSDGTGYSTFGDYFDDNIFETVIDRFERLMDDFAALAD